MAILFQLKNIAGTIFFLLLVSPTALADDFCSLTVRVATRDGYKPSGVLVTMVESGSSRARTVTTNAGEAKFCDLGITGVTVMIGPNNQCEEVIKGITLIWQVERVVNAIYDPEYCRNNDQLHELGCDVLLRFVDGPGWEYLMCSLSPLSAKPS